MIPQYASVTGHFNAKHPDTGEPQRRGLKYPIPSECCYKQTVVRLLEDVEAEKGVLVSIEFEPFTSKGEGE